MSLQKGASNVLNKGAHHTVSWADALGHEGVQILERPSQALHPLHDINQARLMKDGYLSRNPQSKSWLSAIQPKRNPQQVLNSIEPQHYSGNPKFMQQHGNLLMQGQNKSNRSINSTYLKQKQQQVKDAASPQNQAGKDGPQA